MRLTIAQVVMLALPGLGAGQEVRRDHSGDPLPPGAIARMGSARLRHLARDLAFQGAHQIVSVGTTIRTWSLPDGRLLREHSPPLDQLAGYGFSGNGSVLVTVNQTGVLQVWDTATGKPRLEIPVASPPLFRPGNDLRIQVSTDGSSFMTQENEEQGILVWSAIESRKPVRLKIPANSLPVRAVFAPTGNRAAALLYTGEVDDKTTMTLAFWDAKTGNLISSSTMKIGHSTDIAIAPDGKSAAIISEEGVGIFSQDGKERWRIQFTEYVQYVRFTPDGRLIAVKRIDGDEDMLAEMLILDPANGKVLGKWQTNSDDVVSFAFSPDSQSIALAGENRIRVKRLLDGRDVTSSAGHSNSICTTCMSADGKYIASTDFMDRDILLWEVATGREVRRFQGHTRGCIEIVLSADGKRLASSSYDRTVRIWDVATGRELRRIQDTGAPIWHLRFSADSTVIATSPASGKQVTVYDVGSGNKLQAMQAVIGELVTIVRHPEGRILLIDMIRGDDGERDDATVGVRIWDVMTGKQVQYLHGHHGRLLCAHFSPDGRMLATRADDGWFRLWEFSTGQLRLAFEEGGPVRQSATQIFAWSPDGRTIASVCMRESMVRLWNAMNGELITSFPAHDQPMYTVEFTPDGASIVTGSQDATLLTWEIRAHMPKPPQIVRMPLTESALEQHWSQLLGTAEQAYQSLWALVGDPDRVVPFLSRRFRRAESATPEQVQTWIGELTSPRFAVRERAERELRQHLDSAMVALRRAHVRPASSEAAKRIGRLLEGAERVTATPDILRELRAVEVLEQIGGDPALQLLERLPKQGVRSVVANGAAAAVQRIRDRRK